MAVEELTVKLNDEVTANARRAAASAKALADRFSDLKGVEKRTAISAARAIVREEERKITAMSRLHEKALAMDAKFNAKRAKQRLTPLTPGNTIKRTETGGIGGAINSFAGNLGANIASSAAGAAVNAARAAYEGIAFRESTLMGLGAILKSSSEAERIYKLSMQLGRDLGTGGKATAASMQKLLASGFSEQLSTDLIKSTADIKGLNANANVDGVVLALSQIKSMGRLTAEELNQLNENSAGIASRAKMYENIGKAMGVTAQEAAKLAEQGKVSSDVAIKAFMDAVQATSGKGLGELAKERAGSMTGLFAQLADVPDDLFASLQLDPAAMASVSSALKDIMKMASDPAVGKGISAMITIMAQVGVGAAKSFAESMVAVGKIAGLFGDIASAIGSAGGALQAFGSFLFNAVVMGPAALLGAVSGVFVSIGTAIVQGIASGITSAGGAIYDSLASAVQSAKDRVSSALGIKSPSRVFADEVGAQMSAGMAVGIMSGAERVRMAAASVATGAVPANNNGRAGGGSAGGISVGSVTVMVNMGGGGGGGSGGGGSAPSGQAIGQDAAKAFWTEVRKLAEAG